MPRHKTVDVSLDKKCRLIINGVGCGVTTFVGATAQDDVMTDTLNGETIPIKTEITLCFRTVHKQRKTLKGKK